MVPLAPVRPPFSAAQSIDTRFGRCYQRGMIEHLMKSGEYRTIATLWGVERGTIDRPVINGANR